MSKKDLFKVPIHERVRLRNPTYKVAIDKWVRFWVRIKVRPVGLGHGNRVFDTANCSSKSTFLFTSLLIVLEVVGLMHCCKLNDLLVLREKK